MPSPPPLIQSALNVNKVIHRPWKREVHGADFTNQSFQVLSFHPALGYEAFHQGEDIL